MSRTPLAEASESLREAAEHTDDEAGERLQTQAEQLESLSNADRGPDHGRLARHEHVLRSIADEEGGAVTERIDDALASISSYRETLEGV